MFHGFGKRLAAKKIHCEEFDGGDGNAGSIRVVQRGASDKEPTIYQMLLNRNHAVSVRFVTLAHELGHLFLGHLGADKTLSVPRRQPLTYAERELEAESVAYVVAERSGVKSKSQTYLASFVKRETTIDDLDVYQVMRAGTSAGRTLTPAAIRPTRRRAPGRLTPRAPPRPPARSAYAPMASAGPVPRATVRPGPYRPQTDDPEHQEHYRYRGRGRHRPPMMRPNRLRQDDPRPHHRRPPSRQAAPDLEQLPPAVAPARRRAALRRRAEAARASKLMPVP